MSLDKYLPVEKADKALWCISFALHILLPSILFFLLVRYVQVETKLRNFFTGARRSSDAGGAGTRQSKEKLDFITWIRFSNLLFTTAMTFMYLMFYVPIPFSACDFAVRFVMGLPFVSRAHNFVFYVLRYVYLEEELTGKANAKLKNGLVSLGLAITFVGWLPFWAGNPFLEGGFCLGVLNPEMIYALGISLLFDFCFGLGLLYMFTIPIEKAFKAMPVTAGRAQSNSHSLESVVLRTKWTCYASVTSGLCSTILLALTFLWYPNLLWLVFLSDIVSGVDAFINCTSMLYTFKHFNEMLFLRTTSAPNSRATNQNPEVRKLDSTPGITTKTSERV